MSHHPRLKKSETLAEDNETLSMMDKQLL